MVLILHCFHESRKVALWNRVEAAVYVEELRCWRYGPLHRNDSGQRATPAQVVMRVIASAVSPAASRLAMLYRRASPAAAIMAVTVAGSLAAAEGPSVSVGPAADIIQYRVLYGPTGVHPHVFPVSLVRARLCVVRRRFSSKCARDLEA